MKIWVKLEKSGYIKNHDNVSRLGQHSGSDPNSENLANENLDKIVKDSKNLDKINGQNSAKCIPNTDNLGTFYDISDKLVKNMKFLVKL